MVKSEILCDRKSESHGWLKKGEKIHCQWRIPVGRTVSLEHGPWQSTSTQVLVGLSQHALALVVAGG